MEKYLILKWKGILVLNLQLKPERENGKVRKRKWLDIYRQYEITKYSYIKRQKTEREMKFMNNRKEKEE